MSASRTPFCGHCKNMGKSEREYTSHTAHKTQSQNSPLTCPELLKKVCTRCASRNHTFDKCKLQSSKPLDVYVAKPSVPSSSALNKYSGLLSDDDSDNDNDNIVVSKHESIFKFNMETLYWLSPKDQPEYIGEELYSRLYAQYTSYTGKIVGMFLEFDVSDLVELLENPDLLKEKAEEAFDLLNKHNYQTHV